MESMYQTYRDIAEFRLVYITEAHASDGHWPVGYAKDKGITEHDDYAERCTTADMLLKDKQLTIPFVIDRMDNAVGTAYHAHPDRVFLVRTDGRLAVAADRGPFGFKPGLDAVRSWLETFRKTGQEPPLPEDAAAPGRDIDLHASEAESKTDDDSNTEADGAPGLVGTWWMTAHVGEFPFTATAAFRRNASTGDLTGLWRTDRGEVEMERIRCEDELVVFSYSSDDGLRCRFVGRLNGDVLRGVLRTGHDRRDGRRDAFREIVGTRRDAPAKSNHDKTPDHTP